MSTVNAKHTTISERDVKSAKEVHIPEENLLEQAEATHNEQQTLLETSTLESQYGAVLASYVEGKHDQVERIEDRLEALIEQQSTRLQQFETKQPGLLALLGKKAKQWQSQLQQQQHSLQRLHGRLETIREIKDGMGIHSPRVEELATRKMRRENPELAADWDEMREAQRRHEALLRKKEHDRKQELAKEQKQAQQGKSRTLSQGITPSSIL
ncbi:IncP plasmid survival protein KfrC family protein [Xenorhabdus bovienii]|uniref:IncP plasmid survival protein KfrC family protein n=1 Tax=Xenorhabdus bovienii TaxID=40576 RepID=UPI003DA21621